jgi:oxygen-independent coproporphyrinogen III oxidase
MSSPVVTPELLARYDRPGPRYTSYPTAPHFSEAFGEDQYRERLAAANDRPHEPLSVYFHIPFCDHRCLYCGCHVVITRRDDVVEKYLDHLEREMELVASLLPARREVIQLHWGGGTPTHLTPDQMRRLFRSFTAAFRILPEAEQAVEIDPRVTTPAHLDALRELGFNRLSLGVQDFTPEVQEAVERNQSYEETADLLAYARGQGLADVNVDLIYGLPRQTLETFRDGLRRVVDLRPGRIAVYSYAHVPWIRPHQRKIPEETLPKAETKFALFAAAGEAFAAAGYERIGMDHFALPEDELSRARRGGTLTRNFMGYTVRPGTDLLAFGISGIGEVGGAFVQNEKKLADYYRVLDAGRLPVERGYVLDDDDRIRRFVILSIMCNFELDLAELHRRFGVDYDAYFAREDARLRETIDPGFYRREGDKLTVTPLGQVFIRNVCMVFDRYLEDAPGEKPLYSRTI